MQELERIMEAGTLIGRLETPARRGGARQFVRQDRAATAVEFAMIAPIFMFLVAIAVELSAMVFTIRALDDATERAAREIRTGDSAVRSGSAVEFRKLICQRMPVFADCDSILVVRVAAAKELANLQTALDSAVATVETPAFNPGLPSGYVAVDASYTWEFATPLFFPLSSREMVFNARTAFRNEPFDPANTGGGS